MTKKSGETPEKPDDLDITVDDEVSKKQEITVDLDAKDDDVKKDDDKKEGMSPEDIKKLHNRNEYLNRQMQKQMQQIQELTQQISSFNQNQQGAKKQDDVKTDDLDEIAQKDWKQGVSILAEKVAQQVFEQQQAQLKAAQRENGLMEMLEKSKNVVRERYPDIEDESTELSQMYREILNEDPSLLSNVNGPELAMYRMESKMAANGIQPPHVAETVKRATQQEIQRQTRTFGTGVPRNSTNNGSNTVTLTNDEILSAKRLGIPLKQYAAMYKQSERGFKEGVTVDVDTE